MYWGGRRRVRRSRSNLSVIPCLLLAWVAKCQAFGVSSPPLKVLERRQRTTLFQAKPPFLVEEEETLEDANIQASHQHKDEETKHNDINIDKSILTNTTSIKYQQDTESVLLSRRKWIQRCATALGGAVVTGTAISQRNAEERKLEERKAFIRLEPYPYRQEEQQKMETTATTKTRPFANTTATKSTNTTKSTTMSKNNTNTEKKQASTKRGTNATSTVQQRGNASSTFTNKATNATNKELAPVNFTKVASENSINITLKSCDGGCVRINGTTFQKVRTPEREYPWFWPKFLRPSTEVLRDIPDQEVLLAATLAGSAIEIVRTTVLYPLSTVKTRIQTRQQEQMKIRRARRNMARFEGSSSLRVRPSSSTGVGNTTFDTHTVIELPRNKLRLGRKLRVLQLNVRRHVSEGNLFAGLVPSLLVSVPATGVYYGVRDVTKRMLVLAPGLGLNDAAITLLGAVVADVASLMVRTPADALAARLQAVAASSNSKKGITDGKHDSGIIQVSSDGQNVTVVSSDDDEDDGDVETCFAKDSLTLGETEAYDAPDIASLLSLASSKDDVDTFKSLFQNPELSAEEILYKEEERRYKQKDTMLVVEPKDPSKQKPTSSLPGDQDYLLLMQAQCRDVNVDELYERVLQSTDLPPLTMEERERRERRDVSGTQRAACQILNFRMPPEGLEPLYSVKFLEEAQAGSNNEWNSIQLDTTMVEWDDSRGELSSLVNLWKRQKLSQDNAAAVDATRIAETTLNATIANTTENDSATWDTEDDGEEDEEIVLNEKEEKTLLRELQEESIYQEDWFRQSLERLPAIIITDLPYLLSRIALNRIIIHGTVNIGQYEVATIGIAVVSALLTTPFDVVRTRLLVENDDQDILPAANSVGEVGTNETTTIVDGKVVTLDPINATMMPEVTSNTDYLNQGVIRTMIAIAKEGDGGIQNLYAGWLERTLYFGIGRAWIDPINIITYIGIRDTILLKLFD